MARQTIKNAQEKLAILGKILGIPVGSNPGCLNIDGADHLYRIEYVLPAPDVGRHWTQFPQHPFGPGCYTIGELCKRLDAILQGIHIYSTFAPREM